MHVQHTAARETFPAEPSYVEMATGDERAVPPLVITSDGPQPVYPFPAESWSASTLQTSSDGSPKQAAGRNPARRLLTIVNTASAGGTVLYLAPTAETCTAGGSSAFALLPGAGKDFTHKAPVYVCAANGSTGTYSTCAEFEDGH